MRSFNNPSPCFKARIGFPLCCFLPPRFDMRSVVSTTEKLANVLGVVPFVETDVVAAAAGWLRTFDRNAVEGRFEKSDVVRISAAYFNPQRHAGPTWTES